MTALRRLFAAPGSARRAGLFVAAALLAGFAGYRACSPGTCARLLIFGGYYYILGVFGLFLYYAWRVAKARRAVWQGWLRHPGWVGFALLLATGCSVWSDHFRHKILYDEFVIQGTAYEMHELKQVSTILRAYNLHGTWLSIDRYLDKRPFFFPFLVSLLHDFTGYRIANMFALNVGCAAALLAFLYWFVRQLADRGPALLAVALMALLPLFGQNATGAGMDLHNLTMMALVACLGTLYLRAPDDDRLVAFVLGDVLLTESRYESIIFIFPVTAVVLLGWIKAGRAILPWPVLIAPLLFIPYAWHSRYLKATPIFWQLQEGQTSAFDWGNVAPNFRGDVDFLFNLGPGLANSWYLSVAGLVGLGGCLWRGVAWLRQRPRPALPPAAVVGLAFAVGILGHFVVLLFYWWAKFDDLMASRFALPMCLAFAVVGALFVQGFARHRQLALRAGWLGLGVWLFVSGLPAFSLRFYTDNNLGMKELDWEREVIDARPGPVLFISNKSTIPFILWHDEVLLNNVAAYKGDDIRYHLGQQTFKEVIVSQAIRPIDAEGHMGVDPDDLMPPTFHLQTIAEKRFGGRLDRLSRVVSIDPAPKALPPPPQLPVGSGPARSISWLHCLSDPPVAAVTSAAVSR